MGQSNIDNIFQLIAPIADRTSSTSRFGGDAAGFDDHLSQASTSVFDVARPPSRSESTSSYSTSDSIWSASSYTSTSSSSAPKPVESRNDRKDREPTTSSTSTSNQPAETAAVEKAADNTNHDDHDLEGSTDSDNSGLAGARKRPETAPAKTESSPESDGDEHANAKDAAAAELAAKQHAKRTAKAENKPTQAHAEGNAAKEETATTAAATEETLVDATADESAQTETTETDAKTAKPNTKTPHENAEYAASTVTTAVKTEEATDDASANEETDTEAVPTDKTETQTPTSTKDKASAAAKRSAGADEPSSDETQADGLSTKGNAAPTAVKTDTTAVANGIAANVAADTTAKGEAVTDSTDQVGKSAAVKTEAPANPLDRATRGTTELTRGNGAAKADETTTRVDPSRFVSRVAKAFQTANERGGTLQLRLSPPELGALKIQLTVKDGVMSASMETENAGARRVLLEHLPALRDRLAEQNIRIEKFDVDVRQENTGGQANPHGSNQNLYQPQPESAPQRRANGSQQSASETAAPEAIPLSAKISSTKINLVV